MPRGTFWVLYSANGDVIGNFCSQVAASQIALQSFVSIIYYWGFVAWFWPRNYYAFSLFCFSFHSYIHTCMMTEASVVILILVWWPIVLLFLQIFFLKQNLFLSWLNLLVYHTNFVFPFSQFLHFEAMGKLFGILYISLYTFRSSCVPISGFT